MWPSGVTGGPHWKPISQGVQQAHGDYAPQITVGLGLRKDWGPQCTTHRFLGELAWLGIRPTPSPPRRKGEPQCNGIIERLMRTLKEECLYLHDFETLDEARRVVGDFIARYDTEWLIERHGYRTPAAVRESFKKVAA